MSHGERRESSFCHSGWCYQARRGYRNRLPTHEGFTSFHTRWASTDPVTRRVPGGNKHPLSELEEATKTTDADTTDDADPDRAP